MIPDSIIKALEKETKNLSFGSVVLEIQVHDGKSKFRITKTVSIVPGKLTSGQNTIDRTEE